MTKPILATTLSGLFIKSEPWKKAHVLWFDKAAYKLGDPSVMGYADAKNYFMHVDEVMEKLHPELSEEQRTILARERYFDSVFEYISENLDVINKDVIQYFASLKSKYALALITTNTHESLKKLLSFEGLSDLFDIIEASQMHEKDDKEAILDRFVNKYGKPEIYIGGDRKDAFDYCKRKNIQCIFANLEGTEDLEGVDVVHDLEGLKEKIK